MKINITKLFLLSLNDQVAYISKDKPKAARKFKADLIKKLRKDLKFPYHFKKSIYYDNENIRDYVSVYKIDVENNVISVFGFIKYKEFL